MSDVHPGGFSLLWCSKLAICVIIVLTTVSPALAASSGELVISPMTQQFSHKRGWAAEGKEVHLWFQTHSDTLQGKYLVMASPGPCEIQTGLL